MTFANFQRSITLANAPLNIDMYTLNKLCTETLFDLMFFRRKDCTYHLYYQIQHLTSFHQEKLDLQEQAS